MRRLKTASALLGVVFLVALVSAGPRSATSIDYRYSKVIVSTSSTRSLFVTVNNTDASTSRTFNTSVSGVAEFPDGSFYTIHTLGPMQERRFRLVVNPASAGNYQLEVTTNDTELGITSTDSIPVRARNVGSTQVPREVPGIGLIQVAALALAATVLSAA